MICYCICIAVLIVGFFTYGKLVEKRFGPDDRSTPAIEMEDGVDYVEMPQWRIFLIQLLNIAGLGPIWGASGGALWGPSVFLWITLGTIFAGAVHDYASGFISMRNKGKSLPECCGIYMGNTFRTLIRIFSVILMIMVGVVFSKSPAGLLSYLFSQGNIGLAFLQSDSFWLIVIILYYFVATFLSIDVIIGKFYPIFGVCLLAMAFGVGGGIFTHGFVKNIPEIWSVIGRNMHPAGTGAWPMMFISVACGAISGFHATQSPMMARCCKSEKQAHKIFYGAMVWAGASCSLFAIVDGKMTGLQESMATGQATCIYNICATTMGRVGVILAMLGVIACPITSGDTAYRSARLTIADWFHIDQKNWKKRLALSGPLLIFGYLICRLDYSTVWNYFASCNQILAMIVLWMTAMYLVKSGKRPWIAVVPATFMSCVTMTCVLSSSLYLGKLFGAAANTVGNIGGLVIGVLFLAAFLGKARTIRASQK